MSGARPSQMRAPGRFHHGMTVVTGREPGTEPNDQRRLVDYAGIHDEYTAVSGSFHGCASAVPKKRNKMPLKMLKPAEMRKTVRQAEKVC